MYGCYTPTKQIQWQNESHYNPDLAIETFTDKQTVRQKRETGETNKEEDFKLGNGYARLSSLHRDNVPYPSPVISLTCPA